MFPLLLCSSLIDTAPDTPVIEIDQPTLIRPVVRDSRPAPPAELLKAPSLEGLTGLHLVAARLLYDNWKSTLEGVFTRLGLFERIYMLQRRSTIHSTYPEFGWTAPELQTAASWSWLGELIRRSEGVVVVESPSGDGRVERRLHVPGEPLPTWMFRELHERGLIDEVALGAEPIEESEVPEDPVDVDSPATMWEWLYGRKARQLERAIECNCGAYQNRRKHEEGCPAWRAI